MDYFPGLPASTVIDRVVPKNKFEPFAKTKQKQDFTKLVKRITWKHKLSKETINLNGKEIKEIQLFLIELKEDSLISKVLEVIQKAIPYRIVAVVAFENKFYYSTSVKHENPKNPSLSIIDWTFNSDWKNSEDQRLSWDLKKSLDYIFKEISISILGKPLGNEKSLETIVEKEKEQSQLKREIRRIEGVLKSTIQFNQKLELHQQLQLLKSKVRSGQ